MQVLANRPDIVREDYMNELCALQDDVPAFPSKVQHSAFDSVADEIDRLLFKSSLCSWLSPQC